MAQTCLMIEIVDPQ